MAKGNRDKIKLVSSAGTGHYYTATKNKKLHPEKLETKKYDPTIRTAVGADEIRPGGGKRFGHLFGRAAHHRAVLVLAGVATARQHRGGEDRHTPWHATDTASTPHSG